MNMLARQTIGKVPAVTLGFWVIKILATTLGETGGDAVTMTLGLGYLVGTAIFAAVLMVAVGAQIVATRFHTFLYWAAIVATTTAGTTLGDYLDEPVAQGELALGRFEASAVLAAVIIGCFLLISQRAGRHPGSEPVMR